MELEESPPARRVVTRSPARTVRILNFPRVLDRPVECESSLERDFVYRAILCPSLGRLRHQPFTLTLSTGRRYTPDFLCESAAGSRTVVEVKLSTKLEQNRTLFDAATAQLATRNVRFLVLSERAICDRDAHERAALILRYRKNAIDGDLRSRMVAAVRDHRGRMTVSALRRSTKATETDVLHLLAARVLVPERSLRFDATAIVSLPHMESQHEVRIESWFGRTSWNSDPGAGAAAGGREGGPGGHGCEDAEDSGQG